MIHHTDMGASATLTSGLSLPEIMMNAGGHHASTTNELSDAGHNSQSPLSSTLLNQVSESL